MKKVTLKDIAIELGITKVSVSKALRDHPDISSKTRIQVKEKAKELGYRPNLVARSLTSAESRTIGLIIPKVVHFFFASVIESICKSAFENNYEVIIGVSQEKEELEKKHLESMLQMRVDGLLVSVSEETKQASAFEAAREMGTELVFFDRGFKDAGFSYVRTEDRKSAESGVQYLIDQGYRDIAHLAGTDTLGIGRDRKQGYLDALANNNISADPDRIQITGYDEQTGYQAFSKIVASKGIPEAVFAVTYSVGLGILAYLKDHDIDPSDLTILSFGKSAFNEHLSHPFICIDQPAGSLGKTAFDQLLKQINESDKSSKVLIELPSEIR